MADFRTRFNVPDDVAITLASEVAIHESFDNDALHIPVVAVVEGGVRFPLAPPPSLGSVPLQTLSDANVCQFFSCGYGHQCPLRDARDISRVV